MANAEHFTWDALLADFDLGPVIRMLAVLFAAFVSFEFMFGFESLITIYDDIKQPAKSIPRSNVLAVFVSLVIYLFVTVAVLVNLDTLAGNAGENVLAETFELVLGPAGAYFMSFAAMFACVTSLLASMINASKIVYAFSRDKFFPGIFRKVDQRTGIPRNALIFTVIVVLAFILLGQLDSALQIADFGFLMGLAFINVTVIALRQKRTELDRPFKIKLYPALPIISTIFTVFLALVLVLQLTVPAIFFLLVVSVTGVMYYLAKIARRREFLYVLGGLKIFGIALMVIFLGIVEVDIGESAWPPGSFEAFTNVVVGIVIAVAALSFFFDLYPLPRLYRIRKERSEGVVVQVGEMKIFAFSEEEKHFINRFNHALGAIQVFSGVVLFVLAGLILDPAFVFRGALLTEAFPQDFIRYSLAVIFGIFAATLVLSGVGNEYMEWERQSTDAY